MCIVHEASLHYMFQNIMAAFESSKMLSSMFLKRVGCLVCTCKKDIFYDSKTIISTQRALYKWFDELINDETNKAPMTQQVERLTHFKPIIDELKENGNVDSGTKITFMSLLKDLYSFNFSKLRRIVEKMKNKKKSSTRNLFVTKVVRLKFDLNLCSLKEFYDLLNKIDHAAIKYIQLTNKCKIVLRSEEHFTVKNFMGQLEATLEARSEKNLYRAELSLKRLADAVHYRLIKKIPSFESFLSIPLDTTNVLLQSPPNTSLSSKEEEEEEEEREAENSQEEAVTDFSTTSNVELSTDVTSTTKTTDISEPLIDTTNTTDKEREMSHEIVQVKECDDTRDTLSRSQTLNGDVNDSFLDINRSSIGDSTPLTSSPMSSSSTPFKFALNKQQHKSKKSKQAKQSKPKSYQDQQDSSLEFESDRYYNRNPRYPKYNNNTNNNNNNPNVYQQQNNYNWPNKQRQTYKQKAQNQYSQHRDQFDVPAYGYRRNYYY